MAKSAKRRAPLWTRICLAAGVVLVLASGGTLVTGQALVAKYAGAVTDDSLLPAETGAAQKKKVDINGPLNILLVGIDPRDTATAPLSDSIIVAHIPANRSGAFLFSIPRDLVVDIPAFAPSGTGAQREKINAAMALGSRIGNGKYDAKQGFRLLAQTVGNVTGIKEFDAGAIVNFGGFQKIVEAMDGVTMVIDQDVKSEHRQPNGLIRPRRPECADNHCDHPYIGPQKQYKKSSKPVHLEAWEALDYVRQRYGLPRTDYDRQRHQQQFIKAIAKQAMGKDVVTNPSKLLKVMGAAGDSLTFAGGGHSILDWALELKGLNVDDTATIDLPGGGVFKESNGQRRYLGEQFAPEAGDFFRAVREDRVPEFLFDHPKFVQAKS